MDAHIFVESSSSIFSAMMNMSCNYTPYKTSSVLAIRKLQPPSEHFLRLAMNSQYSPQSNAENSDVPNCARESLPPIDTLTQQPGQPEVPFGGLLPSPLHPNWQLSAPVDLSSISRGELDIPPDETGFVISESLKHDLRTARSNGRNVDTLVQKVLDEANGYAERRKELVRRALKNRQLGVHHSLTMIDKGKLRSRRDARVHRVKLKEFESALKSALRWLISELA